MRSNGKSLSLQANRQAGRVCGPAAAAALPSLEPLHKDPKHPLHKPAEDAIEKIKGLKKKDASK